MCVFFEFLHSFLSYLLSVKCIHKYRTFSTCFNCTSRPQRSRRRINRFIHPSLFRVTCARGGGEASETSAGAGASTVKNNSVYHLQNYHFSDGNKRETRIQIFRPSPVFVIRRTDLRLRPRRVDPHTDFTRECTSVDARPCICTSPTSRRVLPHNLHIVARQKPPARGHFSPTALSQPTSFPANIISQKVFCPPSFLSPPLIDMPRQSPLVRSPCSTRVLISRIYSRAWREMRFDGSILHRRSCDLENISHLGDDVHSERGSQI